DAGQGRPTARTPLKASAWPIQAPVQTDDHAIEQAKHATAGLVLGTTIGACALSATAVSAADTGQASVDGGLRFRKAPLLVVSSLLVKKPSRLAGWLMGMPLALGVDSGAPRRLRAPGAARQETVPHHSKPPPIANPTLGFPAVGRHPPYAHDGARSGA